MSLFKSSVATVCVLLSALFLLWAAASIAQEKPQGISIAITDTAGDPISTASSYWLSNGKAKKLTTSQEGHITVAAATGLVVVQCEGYQCAGLVLRQKTPAELKGASIVLRTPAELGRSFKTLPVPVPERQRKNFVKETIDLHWAQLKSGPKDRSNQNVCGSPLAALDPKAFNEYLDSGAVDAQFKGIGKRLLTVTIAKSDPELAIEVADSLKNPMSRVSVLDVLLENLPEGSPYVEAVEEQFIETIQAISQPAYRYAIWSNLGEHYVHNGQRELADKIVAEHLPEVRKLPNGGWAAFPKSLFAALLVEKDPDLALKMTQGSTGHERARALGRLAFHCCLTKPKLAIDLLDKIEHPERTINTAENRIKVAHRMAGAQTDFAFQVAASINEPNQQAWAWGSVALKLIDSDPIQAKKALENAIQALTVEKPGGEIAVHRSTPVTLAGLMPIAEKVAPEKIESMMWQAVWLTVPRSRWNLGGGSRASKRQCVAAALSRYDREVASALMGDTQIEIGSEPSRSAVIQVALDAAGIPEFMERLNDSKKPVPEFRPRAHVARMLSGSDEEFWNEVSLPEMLQWPTVKFEEY